MTRRELADAAGMSDGVVLEVYLHTPQELERVSVALGWPPGHLLPLVRRARASPGESESPSLAREACPVLLPREAGPP
jgi:hypothetical protein